MARNHTKIISDMAGLAASFRTQKRLSSSNDGSFPPVMDDETAKRRRRANMAIALTIGGFVVLIFVVTIVRLGSNVAQGAG